MIQESRFAERISMLESGPDFAYHHVPDEQICGTQFGCQNLDDPLCRECPFPTKLETKAGTKYVLAFRFHFCKMRNAFGVQNPALFEARKLMPKPSLRDQFWVPESGSACGSCFGRSIVKRSSRDHICGINLSFRF